MYTLKELRIKNNLSRFDIADVLGITERSYADKERGYRGFKPYEIVKICELFGVRVETIKNFLPNEPQNADKST